MNPYILGGGLAAIAIMGLLLKSSYTRNGELEAKLATQAQETRECADANETTLTTIATLEATISDLAALRAAEAADRERVLAERERELQRAQARADQLEREREDEQLANEDCAALSGLRIDNFCPAAAGQLRERSRGPGSHGDTDG